MEAQKQSRNGVAIQVEGISKRFGSLLAVNDVSFAVPTGEIFGLLGPNGAGKSTLIRMLTTLVPPTSGTAIVAGHDIIQHPTAVRSSIGVIPQNMTGANGLILGNYLTTSGRADADDFAMLRRLGFVTEG